MSGSPVPITAHEAREIAPTNAMLDMLESQVRALIELGCEEQVRVRLARLLPPPPSATPASVDRMTAAAILTALKAGCHARMTESERAANKTVREVVLRWVKTPGEPK